MTSSVPRLHLRREKGMEPGNESVIVPKNSYIHIFLHNKDRLLFSVQMFHLSSSPLQRRWARSQEIQTLSHSAVGHVLPHS